MNDNLQSEIIWNLKDQLISTLLKKQKPNGEFELFAFTDDGKQFYIGESPFLTAHIIYLLHGIEDERVQLIIEKAIGFLENIDYTDKRIYKFWYKNVVGTDFPLLPFDLDDTAVVNQVLALYNRRTVNPEILLNNRTKDELFYTWLKPSLKTIIKHPDYVLLFKEYLKSYPIFLRNENNLKMAEYNDSEIIVRLNIYIMMAMLGAKINIPEKYFPFKIEDVRKELISSLHYDNVAMYYLTLAKFQKHSDYFDKNKTDELEFELRKNIASTDVSINNSLANSLAMYLSLSMINRLKLSDVDIIKKIESASWEDTVFDVCVGNKKFTTYHVYSSVDFSLSSAIKLVSIIQSLMGK